MLPGQPDNVDARRWRRMMRGGDLTIYMRAVRPLALSWVAMATLLSVACSYS